MSDAQRRRAHGLHDGNETPESARDGILAVGHGTAGIRLADGAAHGILAVRAGAAAAGNFIPVNGVALGGSDGDKHRASHGRDDNPPGYGLDRKSTRLNSSQA